MGAKERKEEVLASRVIVREGFTEMVTFEPKLKEKEDKKWQVFERRACPGRRSHVSKGLP